MGNPSSGCAPVQSPMPLAKGSSRHRQSLSISSLPLEKLGKINCVKRTSSSALSSPAKVPLTSPAKVPLTDTEKLSIATFLGHGHAKHEDLTRRKVPSGTEELYLKGAELATDDRKPMSFNPFPGHRRVGSGSFTTPCKSASEYSPRARSGSTSIASSPKKLDKYTVAKIAASLFHSPAKLQRSMSLSRVAHRSAPEVVKKVNRGPSLEVGEVILPASLEVSPFTQSADVEDGGNRSSSDSDLTMDMEESASPQISNAPSLQQSNIDITKMLGGEGEAEEQAVTIPDVDPLTTTEDITSGSPSLHSQAFLNAAENSKHTLGEDASLGDVLSSPSSSQSSCMESIETISPLQLESHELGHDSPESIAALFEDATDREESNDIADDDSLQLLLLATEKVPEENVLMKAAVQCSLASEEHDLTSAVSENKSLPISSAGSSVERDMSIQVPEMKSTVRKRRRSVSASGIGAMLLKVVRVSDSAQIVTRRIPKVGSPESILSGADALRARKYVLEKTAQISMGVPAHEESALISSAQSTPAHVCQTESEDAVNATYSKFVDIEIDPGGDCVEVVQRSKDAQDGTGFGEASTFETRQRSQQTTPGTSPRHLHHHERSTCTVHEGIVNDTSDTQTRNSTPVTSASSYTQTADDRHGGRQSKEPTNRTRINSSDLHSLKECLNTVKTANSDLDLAHTTTTSSNQPSITRERSRTIVSRLQAPNSGAFSRVDVYRPCSTVSILANPSFSSSHQDKLWEEQAEIYSSGGRGTPGREDKAAANVIMNLRTSPSAAFATDSCGDHHEVTNRSLRRGGVVESSGKKRGRPNTPLRGLLEDQRRASPESGHFIQQIMSRIRGSNSPKASSSSSFPKTSQQLAMEKRRNTWSSCICFSVK